MRRLFRLKNRKILAGPYLFWAMSFIIIPLLMILYYGLTDKNGSFTLNNLSQMTTPENLKALGLALLLSFISTLICLVLAYPLAMILAEKNMNQTSFIVLIFILPMWMNFLLRTLAWQTLLEKKTESLTAYLISSIFRSSRSSILHLPLFSEWYTIFFLLWYFRSTMCCLRLIKMLSTLPEISVRTLRRHFLRS